MMDLVVLALLLGCRVAHSSEHQPSQTAWHRENAEKAARAIVESMMGREFLDRYLTLDSTKGKFYPAADGPGAFMPAHWSVAFRMRIPGKTWFPEFLQVQVDSTGGLVRMVKKARGRSDLIGSHQEEPYLGGLCDCVGHPEECTFGVDESTAVQAAKRAGFREGLKPWIVEFNWFAYAPTPCYAWVIRNTLHIDPDSCSSSGQMMGISSSTGEVVSRLGWDSICDFALPPDRKH